MGCECNWRAVSVIIGGILVHLTLGTVFSFGNLTPYMTSYLRQNKPDLTYSDSIWIYACALMGQGFFIFLGGFIGRRFGVRVTTILGSWVMSIGVASTYFSIQHSFIATIFTYGVINGAGVGMGYPMPMSCAMKWMPERRGLAGGLVVAGFGGGAFIFNFIQTAFINPDNLSPDLDVNGEKFFTQTELLERVPWAFVLTGGLYALMQLIGVILLRDPPALGADTDLEITTPTRALSKGKAKDYTSTGVERDVVLTRIKQGQDNPALEVGVTQTDVPVKETDVDVGPIEMTNETTDDTKDVTLTTSLGVQLAEGEEIVEMTPLEVLRTRAFYTLWFTFLFNGQGIVFLSSLYKDYGQTYIANDVFLASAGAFASVFNFSGRMFWGTLADKFSYRTAMLCLTTTFTCLMMTFNAVGYGGKPVFFIWVCLLFGTLSGNYSLLSLASAQSFGQKNYAINFGFVFTSQAITAPMGAILSSQLKLLIGWFGMFSMIAAFSLLSVILTATFPTPIGGKIVPKETLRISE